MCIEASLSDEHRNRIIGLCAAIQAKAGVPMTPQQAERVMRDLMQSPVTLGITPGSALHFDSIGVIALANRLDEEITDNEIANPHLQHDALAQLLESEWQLAVEEEQIEADTMS